MKKLYIIRRIGYPESRSYLRYWHYSDDPFMWGCEKRCLCFDSESIKSDEIVKFISNYEVEILPTKSDVQYIEY